MRFLRSGRSGVHTRSDIGGGGGVNTQTANSGNGIWRSTTLVDVAGQPCRDTRVGPQSARPNTLLQQTQQLAQIGRNRATCDRNLPSRAKFGRNRPSRAKIDRTRTKFFPSSTEVGPRSTKFGDCPSDIRPEWGRFGPELTPTSADLGRTSTDFGPEPTKPNRAPIDAGATSTPDCLE